MNKWLAICVISVSTIVLTACGGTSVKRVDAGEQIDLSGAWNDTDSQLVSEELIQDALSRPWVDNFVRQQGSSPAVIVGSVRNLSHEHINVRTFVADTIVDVNLVENG